MFSDINPFVFGVFSRNVLYELVLKCYYYISCDIVTSSSSDTH